ncbi:TPA: hypothetical protein ML354_001633 [Salmonella enterica]|nr:hypothetical protein [Salmonella enterica]
MGMKSFRIPMGLNSKGELVIAEEATKGVNYQCPNCRESLSLRAGKVRKKHFAHRADTECDPESVEHKIGKILIEKAIIDNAYHDKSIILVKNCLCCYRKKSIEIRPGYFIGCEQEKHVGSYVCDVLAATFDNKEIAIEVFHTHKVDEDKAIGLPVQWFELDVESIFENPYHWSPENGKYKPYICPECIKHFKKVISICHRWNIPRNLYTPINLSVLEDKYVADITYCWKCEEMIPVFSFGSSTSRPYTVQYRYSKTAQEKYWANTCPKCKAMQGDWFIYMEPSGDGLLYHLQHIAESDDKFENSWGTIEDKILIIQHLDSRL